MFLGHLRSIALAAGTGVALCAGAAAQAVQGACLSSIGPAEWRVLSGDLDPEKRKAVFGDPAVLKVQSQGLREMLAMACQAQKDGLSADEISRAELDDIRLQIVATEHEKRSAGDPKVALLSTVSKEQVDIFYSNAANIALFEKFLGLKVKELARSGSELANRPVTEEERANAKETFAKLMILKDRSLSSKSTPAERQRIDFKVRMHQAQYLARRLSEATISRKTVTDAEKATYLAAHPELGSEKKRAAAEAILARAKAGESFAELADLNTEDPGNTLPNGGKNGGLYSGIGKGVFVPAFEKAALELKPGEIYPTLVESDFGFHIIKLEKVEGEGDAVKYDARHILIATGVDPDPADPTSRPVPVDTYVRDKLADEKEKAFISKIVAENPVTIAPYTGDAVTKPAKKPVRKRAKK